MAQQELKVNITGDSRKLNNALSSASSKLSSFGSKMQGVGKSLSTRLTLPLVAAGAAATKLALDFDKSMTQIQSLVGVSASEVSKMGEAAKRMAVDTGKSANEAAEALFFITSAGLRGEEAMQVLEASLKAAAVGLGETKTIADLSTSALNAYGSENLSASEATDILTAAVREGKLEASQLAGSMGGVIPIASNMGVSFNEVAAAMAAMSRTGTNAAEGATQLNAILMSLQKPAEKSQKILATLGLSFEDLEKSVKQDGLLNTLTNLKESLQGTGIRMKDLFPNVRALKGVLDLTGAGVESNKQIFEALNNTMGATDEAFQKTSQSASFKFKKGMESMKSSLLEIGTVILPAVVKAVTKLSEFIKSLTDRFKNLSPFVQNLVLGFGGILAAAGPLLIIFGKIMTGLSALGPVLSLAATGFRALNAVMIANPILAVAAAIAAIGVAIYSYTKAQKDALNEVETIEQVEQRIAEKRKKLAEEQAKVADGYGGQVKKNVQNLKEEIAALEQKEKAIRSAAKAVQESENTTQQDSSDSGNEKTKTIDLKINPIIDESAKEKLKKLQAEINKALVTNDKKAYEQRKKDAENYYNNLINNEKTTAEQRVSLEQAKQEKLKQIEETEKERINQKSTEKQEIQRKEQQSLLDLKQKFADATNVSEEDQKALEIQRIQAKYDELRRLAAENNLLTAEQQAAFDAAQLEAEAAVYEQKKVNFLGFTMEMQTAMELANKISGQVQASFGMIGNSITNMLGGAQSAMGAFVGTLAKDALKIVGHNLKVSMSNSITGATESAKSFGPAAAFVLPALIAGATALVSSSFSKFADGGIVSGPTMGLVGEYPGARSNPEVIAPLNKLQNIIGNTGGSQNITVGGQIRLDGQDLLIAIERANETAERIF
ncbi:phage tail tape measure protein [uncultured Polaribacter sp.]|uniref:phage tail tape measure protein n=1 Tax=uncultured Polaribacter sp. TaxID=174711 RepID=UPI00259B1AF4|nr:phage tail tape measure protein [uncultured Polaribacter sp.]